MASKTPTRLLIVDDDPDIQAIAKLSLETVGGFTVHTCGSGIEAINAAPAFEPELILLDVMMPDMDGPTTLRALRGIPEIAATPVVFMTAKVQPYEVEHIRELGAIDIISKPFDPMTLSTAIHRIWARHRD